MPGLCQDDMDWPNDPAFVPDELGPQEAAAPLRAFSHEEVQKLLSPEPTDAHDEREVITDPIRMADARMDYWGGFWRPEGVEQTTWTTLDDLPEWAVTIRKNAEEEAAITPDLLLQQLDAVLSPSRPSSDAGRTARPPGPCYGCRWKPGWSTQSCSLGRGGPSPSRRRSS